MQNARIEIPKKLIPVFAPPHGALRYRGAFGGRGSAKSATFATMALVRGIESRKRILCGREFQGSITESFFAELKNSLERYPQLAARYHVGSDWIEGVNGTEFFFKGLHHNVGSVKSISNVDIFIGEEAEDIPAASMIDVEPTIRKANSEIWMIWNPKNHGTYVDKLRTEPPQRSRIVEINWQDNPWFNEVLEEQRQRALATFDDATYRWVWEGAYLTNSKAQIFAGRYRTEQFTVPLWREQPTWEGPYLGLDFGFSQDPSAFVVCWIDREHNKLYIEHEGGGVGIENDDLAGMVLGTFPAANRNPIRADSARPETISYLARHGLPMIEPVVKGAGSVEDGIMGIKSFAEVVIHPRCAETLKEFERYSFKVDRNTGAVTSTIIDANNHYIDAIRYALQPVLAGSIAAIWGKQ